jgi:hypothetical protein
MDAIEDRPDLRRARIFCRIGLGHGSRAELPKESLREQIRVAGLSAVDALQSQSILSERQMPGLPGDMRD